MPCLMFSRIGTPPWQSHPPLNFPNTQCERCTFPVSGPGLAALQARTGPWNEHSMVVLTWGQPWPEGGTSANQLQHAMGLVFLEGQLPRHHGMEDDPSGDPASSGCCPS